ncbi:pemk protein [Rhodanobacter sp. B04]|uniref:type II toxin-antitoxin system PemK/MazF family toxin n=1 Tax=Rhodanobacter sp. B04 TaxID=1945860 RepID=UPI0009856DF9|nr:type II toxin-antitoxin system PemK/MazF family toxin [Rhodanobacter sp. B04]OOG65454.1 pemk protein [Rhodanobacter sp. B04]
MSRGIPQRGDILELSLDPTHVREIRGSRPVLVLSADTFNKASDLLLVAPITQGGSASRENGFSVTLMGTGTATQGVVLCDQTHTVDACARTFRRIEKAPIQLVDEALDAVRSILE